MNCKVFLHFTLMTAVSIACSSKKKSSSSAAPVATTQTNSGNTTASNPTTTTSSSPVTTAPADSATAAFDYSSLATAGDYTVFSSKDQAKAWYEDAKVGLGDYGDLVDFSDPRYVKLDEIINKLWPAFQQLYPDRVGNVPAPIVLLLNSDEPNAFATADYDHQMFPNVFFILTGMVKGNVENYDELLGVTAHELSHLVLLHVADDVADSVTTYYYASSHNEPIGALQKNDPDAQVQITAWQKHAYLVGGISIREFRDVPLGIFGTTSLADVINDVIGSQVDKVPACKQASDAEDSVYNYISLDPVTDSAIITDHDDLKSAVAAFKTAFLSCAASDTRTVAEAVAPMLNILPSQVLAGMDADEIVAFTQSDNLGEGIIAASQLEYDLRESIGRQYSLIKMRIFDAEEQADNSAVAVLRVLGLSPATTMNKMLEEGDATDFADSMAACLDQIQDGDAPAYGVLTDQHRADCYRIYSNNTTANYLADHNLAKFDVPSALTLVSLKAPESDLLKAIHRQERHKHPRPFRSAGLRSVVQK